MAYFYVSKVRRITCSFKGEGKKKPSLQKTLKGAKNETNKPDPSNRGDHFRS